MRGLAMSDTTESDDERPCLHCLIGDVIDEFYAEYGSLSGEKDTIDVDEIITALAKTVAEMTFGSDAALRQRILEDLTREISQFEAEVANAPASDGRARAVNPSVLACRSGRGHQRWRPIGSSRCARSAQSDQTKDAPAGGDRRGRSLGYPSQRLDRHLQVLGRPECDFLARFDLDGFSGRRVAPH